MPLLVLGALWFRRGRTIRWLAIFALAAIGVAPERADAADWNWLDPWLTRNQQGRLAYERGEHDTAAHRFADAMWRGVVAAHAVEGGGCNSMNVPVMVTSMEVP